MSRILSVGTITPASATTASYTAPANVSAALTVTLTVAQDFLLASSTGDGTFAVYRRGRDNGWLGQRQVVDGAAADGCSATRGIEAVAANLGPDFPAGIFVCQDGHNTPPGPTEPGARVPPASNIHRSLPVSRSSAYTAPHARPSLG